MLRTTMAARAPVVLFAIAVFAACAGGRSSVVPSSSASSSGGARKPADVPPFTVSGQIQSTSSGVFLIQAGPGCGLLNVYTSGATVYTNGQTLRAGTYAQAWGTGDCSTQMTASSVSLAASAAGPFPTPTPTPAPTPTPTGFTVSGQIQSTSTGVFLIQAGSGCGFLNVYTSGAAIYANGQTLQAGTYAKAWGSGSCATQMNATAVSLAASAAGPFPTPTPAATPTPTPVVATHIGGYTQHFCLPSNNTSPCYQGYTPGVTAAQVAAWDDYVETFGSAADIAALRGAGVPHVLIYADPNLNYDSDAGGTGTLPSTRNVASDFLSNDRSPGVHYWNLANSSTSAYLSSTIAAAVSNLGATGIMNDDNVAAIDIYGSFNTSNQAQTVNESTWDNATWAFWNAMGIEIVPNGLGAGADNGTVDQLQLDSLNNGYVKAGMFEECYLTNSMPQSGGRADNGAWVSTGNSALAVAAIGKDFVCLTHPQNGTLASDRIYAYASLMITYDARHTRYFNDMTSTSNTDVFPESGFVPTGPLVAQPSTVAPLNRNSTGVYAREYTACYNRGTLVGSCAFVVNPSDTTTVSLSSLGLSGTYANSMIVATGDDVFNGGTIGFSGSVPASLGPVSATILIGAH